MNTSFQIIDITAKNISEYPPVCFLNPKNEGYQVKLKWVEKRFVEGMRIKQLYLDDKKGNGFIEYVLGEFVWRAVDARDYLFIHCLWITPNKHKKKGYGSFLIQEVIKDAKKEGKCGVAVITSEGPFMASRKIFEKNGFKSVEQDGKFDLMVNQFKKGSLPKFNDWQKQLDKYKDLNIVYSNQCPWVARFVHEIEAVLKGKNIKLKITELKTAKQAQNAPSIYATFNLIYDGKLLADHYISNRRFLNIIEKELKL